MFRDHRCSSFSLSSFCRSHPFLPDALKFLLITSLTSFSSPPCSLFSLFDLLPTLYADLIERFHLSFPAGFFFGFVLRSFDHNVDTVAFAFAGEDTLIFAD
jgi:hypothetical protein